ncbi:NAD-dependent epimerase/dehydratase family protein [Micromonospora echinofusca]|uniref:NAD-dependent epimerase/dehydratase family protein n=1 Tax=Micromonospora echinofusca TaxID=47858 RepID=A0ABS3VX01_MICEH|nr:NAD-dependent epimerase/dehydratase family protein [Micromonospora echinofusca]MBO4209065.1 NAD-dependent epimerase/dehydratase family protein [Micromonospora echinofusca]
MTVRLLVLGGTAFVGRAVTEEAQRRGWTVTTFSRGHSGKPPAGVEGLYGDRTDPDDLRQLAGRRFDLVVDTWRDDPAAVRASTALLADTVDRYVYVSSLSVYRWPAAPGFDENAPRVTYRPPTGDDPFDAYAMAKTGGEQAVRETFGDRALLARTGVILGPYEYVGRLPWWLLRIARGGTVLAPGPADAPLQYVDCRDLADWLLTAGLAGRHGPYNVLSEPGHTTMAGLLDACRTVTGSTAELVWVPGDFLLDQGVRAWSELPIWLPASDRLAATYQVGVSRVTGTGLRCRDVQDTVADTWRWLGGLDAAGLAREAGQHKPWLTAEREAAVLAAWQQATAG